MKITVKLICIDNSIILEAETDEERTVTPTTKHSVSTIYYPNLDKRCRETLQIFELLHPCSLNDAITNTILEEVKCER